MPWLTILPYAMVDYTAMVDMILGVIDGKHPLPFLVTTALVRVDVMNINIDGSGSRIYL